MDKSQMNEMKRQGKAMGSILGSVEEEFANQRANTIHTDAGTVVIAPNGNMLIIADNNEDHESARRMSNLEERQRRHRIEDDELLLDKDTSISLLSPAIESLREHRNRYFSEDLGGLTIETSANVDAYPDVLRNYLRETKHAKAAKKDKKHKAK
jgi:hypothetical protein